MNSSRGVAPIDNPDDLGGGDKSMTGACPHVVDVALRRNLVTHLQHLVLQGTVWVAAVENDKPVIGREAHKFRFATSARFAVAPDGCARLTNTKPTTGTPAISLWP